MEEPIINKGRILGIDYGKKYVGIAISDPLLIVATGHSVIERPRPNKQRQTLAMIASLCEEYEVSSIVIGLPKNLDGSENIRCEHTYEFAQLLFKRIGIPIFLWDERLTTISSDRELEFLGIKNKKDYSDIMAAQMILQGFIDSIKNGVENTPYLI